jgi:hypothetical protein
VEIEVECVNDPPVVAVDPSNLTVQYSDEIETVTVTATDVDSEVLSATILNSALPSNLVLSAADCTQSNGGGSCSWTIGGQVMVAADDYLVHISIDDGDLDGTVQTPLAITVEPEDAKVAFGDNNPVAVQVSEPGGDSDIFLLTVYISEVIPDDPEGLAQPGDINLAEVSVTLQPVGPGGEVTGICIPGNVTGSLYDAGLPITCSFDSVEVNTYTVAVLVGGDYYAGYAEDVLTVYDPSLGFTTGGGWFFWPGTGERTNFGYTMKYNKKATNIKGSFLMIRHMPDGSIYRIKSNALYGLALGDVPAENFGWASFSGKATYKEPSWPDPIGNHEFVTYVEDQNEPGDGLDQIWVEVHDKDGMVIVNMSMERLAHEHCVGIEGGNLVVPH